MDRFLPIICVSIPLLSALFGSGWMVPELWWFTIVAVPTAGWVLLLVFHKPSRFLFVGPALLTLLLCVLYRVNATHHWVEGTGLIADASLTGLPGTAYPQGTIHALFLLLGLWSVGALVVQFRQRDLERFMVGTCLVSAVLGFWVLSQRIEFRPFPVYPFTGPFRYENHFAALANLLFPLTLFAGFQQHWHALEMGKKSSPAVLCFLAAILLGAAVLYSGSRAGIFLLSINIIGCLWIAFPDVVTSRADRGQVSRNQRAIFIAAVAVIMGGVLFGVVREWAGLTAFTSEISFRLALLSDSFRVFLSQPLWGTGPGSFGAVFPYFQSEALAGRTVQHAHCESVQWLAELGVAGCGVIFVLLMWARRHAKGQWNEGLSVNRMVFGLSLLTVCLHSLVDFPFRHPAIALYSVVMLVLFIRQAEPASFPTPIWEASV